ncbi:MAG: hypothetical protein AAF633_15105 [Chloroflexota bacterium]
MFDKSNMNKVFADLAPQFLVFLENERAKIEKEISRLKAADSKSQAGTAGAEEPETREV